MGSLKKKILLSGISFVMLCLLSPEAIGGGTGIAVNRLSVLEGLSTGRLSGYRRKLSSFYCLFEVNCSGHCNEQFGWDRRPGHVFSIEIA